MPIEIRKMKPLLGLREPLSSLTHLLGFVLSLIGLVWLVYNAIQRGGIRYLASFSIFGISLVLVYLSSTLYHSLTLNESQIIWLKRIDHMMIFVLIAGTYTPICLIALRGVWGWSSFVVIWSLAVVGIFCKMFWIGMPRWAGVAIYLIMSWLVVLLMPQLSQVLSAKAIGWIGLGGLFYSLGAIIYALKWPNFVSGVWEFHETWHVFVLGGSACHFFAILAYL